MKNLNLINDLKNIDIKINASCKFNDLSNELLKLILYYIKDINIYDITKIYEISLRYRLVIKDEINNYFKIKDSKTKKEHYLYTMIKKLEDYLLKNDIDDIEDIENLESRLYRIKELYNKGGINEYIIMHIIKCNICKINIQFLNICLNCRKIICSNCCIICEYCNLYGNEKKYYHCVNCENKCFKIITEKLENINLIVYHINLNKSQLEEYIENSFTENYKDIIIQAYEFITNDNNEDPLNIIEYDYINDFEISDEIKIILELFADEISSVYYAQQLYDSDISE